MSKEIDFSKAPEGATHYGISEVWGVCWYKNITEKCYEFYYAEDIGKGCSFDKWSANSGRPNHSPIKIPASWSIYTNDLPLDELTDEQAAILFNHWRNGGETEYKLQGDNPWLSKYPMSQPTWCGNVAYRAIKPKSERELFVEKCVKSIKSHNSDDHAYYDEWFGQLFDNGCRFIKDAE